MSGLSSDRPRGTYGVNVSTEVDSQLKCSVNSAFALVNLLLAAEYSSSRLIFTSVVIIMNRIISIIHSVHLLHEYLCDSLRYLVDGVEENILEHLST